MKTQTLSMLAVLALYSTTAFSQVTVQETTRTGMDGSVTKVITKTSDPVIEVPAAPSTTVHTTVTTTEVAPVTTTHSETKWKTVETTPVMPGARMYSIVDFDLNGDRILSLPEVGEKLFKMYDTDGNNIIDNIEYERRAVLTVTPVEKNTTISYDFNGDGVADQTTTTLETFSRQSMLTRFDKNGDGLSPHEFTDRSFLIADINNDHAIDLAEWKGTYIASIDADNKDKALLNK